MTIKWEIAKIPLRNLKQHPKNPRQISKDQMQRLESLIDDFGLIDKPIVNQDMMIIGGHQRIRILKKMKEKTVECWVPDRLLNEQEINRLCIGLNLNQGHWDYDILANQWDMKDLLDYGFDAVQLLGTVDGEEEEPGEEEKKGKSKASICPSCGHEF